MSTSTVHRQFLKSKWRLREILVAQYAILFSRKSQEKKNKQYSQNSLRCRNKCNIPQKALFMQDDAFRVYIEFVDK